MTDPLGPEQLDPIEANLERLSQLGRAYTVDRGAALVGLEYLQELDPTDPVVMIYDMDVTRMHLMSALTAFPQRSEVIGEMIAQRAITEPLDLGFVEEVVDFISLHEEDEGTYIADEVAEREFLGDAVEALRIRNAQAEYEHGGETMHMARISDGRDFIFFVNEETTRARFETEMLVDPRETLLTPGPEAVITVYGKKFSLDDYATIVYTLMLLPGQAGKLCRDFGVAVDEWAKSFVENAMSKDDDPLLAREVARERVVQLFGSHDRGGFGPFSDIPVHAIFTSVIRRYPELDQFPTPQPFEK